MSRHTDIKHQHEEAVAKSVVDALKLKAIFFRHGDDKSEPDVLFHIGKQILGIEIATVYLDDRDAAQEHTIASGKRKMHPAGELSWSGVQINPDQRTCERVQIELNHKCCNEYSGCDKVWLCIEQREFMADRTSTERCAETLVVPAKHSFEAIFLQYRLPAHDGSGVGLIQLFPKYIKIA